jgi:hypothetical protein
VSARAKDALPQEEEASPELDESVLPPGQRDRSGFWMPAGYDDPTTLVRRRRRRVGPRRAQGADEQEPATA